MDPATTIGLVAAIVQLTELGIKITKRVNDFNSAARADNPPRAFKQILEVLPLIISGLKRLEADISTDHVNERDEKAVGVAVQGCLSEIKDLDNILDKVLPSAGASTPEKYFKAFKSLKYEGRIKEIMRTIGHYTETLTFHKASYNSHGANLEKLPSHQKAFWIVPFDRNALFVGRDDIFEKIESQLKVNKGTQPKAALYGLGGIGKSQIALEYCYRRRRGDEQCSVFWCNAATVASFEESMNRIATVCGLVPKGDAGSDGAEALRSWLVHAHQGPWLMVVDNVDDKDAFFKERTRAGVPPSGCIPQCGKGTLIFTTRSRAIATDLVANSMEPIDIHPMGTAEGLELASKRNLTENNEDDILDLLEVLEYIPLAITQAFSFIAKRQKTVKYYLEQYKKSDMKKTELLNYEFMDHGRQERSMDSVAKTWMLSFEAIQDDNPRAAELLCLIAFFQHQRIPAPLLMTEGEDDGHFQDAADLLKEFSFVDTDMENSVLSTHRLVQLATREWLGMEASDRWATEALKSITARFPPPYSCFNSGYFSSCETLFPHAELVLRYEFKSSEKEVELTRAKLLNSSGRYLCWTGNYDEARSRFKHSTQINTEYLGEKNVETMTSTGLLGWFLEIYDEDPKAVPILKRLVELRQDILGIDDPRTTDATSDLAAAIARTGNLVESEAMQREAMIRSEAQLGRRHTDTLNCMGHLARVLHNQDSPEKKAEALRLKREVYTIRLEIMGPNNMDVLIEGCDLASMLGDREDTYEESYALSRDIIQEKMDIFGKDHPVTLVAVNNFGLLLYRMKKHKEFKDLYVKVLEEMNDGPRQNSAVTQKLRRRLESNLLTVCEILDKK